MNSGSHSLRRIKKYNGNNSYNKEDCGHRTVELVKALQDLHARQEDLLRQLYNIEGSKGSKDTEGYWSNGDNNVASDGNLEVKANRLDDTLLELGERWLMALDWKGNSRKKHDGLIRLDQSENDDCIIKAWMDKRKDDTVEALRDTSSLLATISLTESSRQKDSIIEEDDDKVLDGCKYMDEGEEESIDTECGKVEDGSKEVTEVNNDTATTTLVDNIQSLIECYSDGGCRLDNQTINRNTLNEVASPVSTAVDIVNKLSPIKRRREELRRLNDRVKNKLLQLTVNQRRLSNMDKKEEEREEYNSYTTIRDYRRNLPRLGVLPTQFNMSTVIKGTGQYGNNEDKTVIETQTDNSVSEKTEAKDNNIKDDGWVERRVRSKWQVFRVSAKQSVAFSVLTTSLYYMVNRSRRKVPTKYLIRPTRKLFGLSLALSFSYLYYTYQLEATHNALVNKLHNTWSEEGGGEENNELKEYGERMQRATSLHGSRK